MMDRDIASMEMASTDGCRIMCPKGGPRVTNKLNHS